MITPQGKIAETVVAGLNPITLFVVLINIMSLAIVAFTLYSVSVRVGERDKLLSQIVEKCR